jgi:hypothetical protein
VAGEGCGAGDGANDRRRPCPLLGGGGPSGFPGSSRRTRSDWNPRSADPEFAARPPNACLRLATPPCSVRRERVPAAGPPGEVAPFSSRRDRRRAALQEGVSGERLLSAGGSCASPGGGRPASDRLPPESLPLLFRPVTSERFQSWRIPSRLMSGMRASRRALAANDQDRRPVQRAPRGATRMMPYPPITNALDAYQQAMSVCEHLRRLWPLPAGARPSAIIARRERRARRRAAGTGEDRNDGGR